MISRSQIVSLVLQAVPSFQHSYDEWFEGEGTDLIGSDVIEGEDEQQKADLLARASKGDSSGVPIYLMPLPTHLMKLHEQGNWRELTAASDLIERCLVEGDEYVSNWAVIGVLEGIQNTWSDYGPDKFIPYLRPKSLEMWNELNDFWTRKGKFAKKNPDAQAENETG